MAAVIEAVIYFLLHALQKFCKAATLGCDRIGAGFKPDCRLTLRPQVGCPHDSKFVPLAKLRNLIQATVWFWVAGISLHENLTYV